MVRALLKSYQGTPREAIAFFEDALAEKRYNDAIAAHYGLVASLLRAQDLQAGAERARDAGEDARRRNPMIDAMAGQVLLQSGQVKAAVARYEAALVRYPRQAAAHLRLSGSAAQGQAGRRRRRRS